MQFTIFAYDGKDEDALLRRMRVRQQHLDNILKFKEERHVICAGGLLGEDGNLMGSFLVMEFDSEEDFKEYLATEPYMSENVWNEVRIEKCNVVIGGPEK